MSEQFVDVNGVRLRARLDGPEDSPVLALVNMGSANLTVWDPIMDRLARDHRVLRFDIRGTGQSSGGPDDGYTFNQYADDLLGIMDALGIDRVALVGMAYGARTAARVPLKAPARVSKLALFDASFIPPVSVEERERMNAEAARLLAEAGTPLGEIDKSWFRHASKETARQKHTAHIDDPDITDELAALTMPVLVACGRQDLNLPQSERIAKVIPGARLEVMERTGHGSLIFRPDLVADLILDFLSEG